MSEVTDVDILRHGAALVPRPGRTVLRVTGPDRATWLQGLLTNDVQSLLPGRGCYTCWLTPHGRMLTDADVLAEEDALTIEVPAALAELVRGQLESAVFAEDVHVADESQAWAMVGVHGLDAARVVTRALTEAGQPLSHDVLEDWPEYTHIRLVTEGQLVRLDVYGEPGFVLRVPVAARQTWEDRLGMAGATPVAPAALDFARIAAGRPEFLVDMDSDTIPLEAGIEERAISFTKGCYVGQEVIVRILHRGGGRVAKRLVGLRLAASAAVKPGAIVRATQPEIGRVTSAAWSPRLAAVVALAYVRREFAAPGTSVTVDCEGGPAAAMVSVLPIR